MRHTIFCHPDVLQEVKKAINQDKQTPPTLSSVFNLYDVAIVTNEFMEPYRYTGDYVLPDGRTVVSEDVHIKTKFVTYTPEDVGYLLWSGIIRRHKEPNIAIMDHSSYSTLPGIPSMRFSNNDPLSNVGKTMLTPSFSFMLEKSLVESLGVPTKYFPDQHGGG